ncbi:S1 family peptidase [Membranihabitans maritimus]|uniref:S1 family peptidase n=1 Tax=Membranihabitans maritimus TaxID=2904244 RepID=UPI001F15965A|nr:serine protease [Membranihabitans maritimus]
MKDIVIFMLMNLMIGAYPLGSQDLAIDKSVIGILKMGDINMGTAFVCEYQNIIVSCRHTFNNVANLSFQTESGQYKIEVLHIAFEQDFSILRTLEKLDADPISINPSLKEINVNDTISYYGYDSRIMHDLDTIFPVDSGKATIRSIGKTSELKIYELDFIDFYGKGIPGYSGGPVLDNKGNLVGIIYQGYIETSLKSDSDLIVNKAIIPFNLKEKIDAFKDEISIYENLLNQTKKGNRQK